MPRKTNGSIRSVVVVFVLLLFLPFFVSFLTRDIKITTAEDRAKRAESMKYLDTFRVVRVCPVAPEAFGQFVMQGSDQRYWLSAYAKPTSWSSVVPLGDVQPDQVC